MRPRKPQYMVIYKCDDCGHESGYTELDKPSCRACGESALTLLSKQKITPEVLAARLKVTTDNMMRNLESAYQDFIRSEDKVFGDDKDAEAEFLRLMARAKSLRDRVQSLELKEPPHPSLQTKKHKDSA